MHKPMLHFRSNWLSTTYSRRILDRNLSQLSNVFRGVVLDIGGRGIGQVQYRMVYGGGFAQWISVNLSETLRPDLVANAAALPLVNHSVDVVLCTQVLEHICPEHLSQVAKEMHRVLRNPNPVLGELGGVLVLSVPFLYRIHGVPQDYLRFTEYFLQCWLGWAGFRVIQTIKIGLFFTVLCDMVKQAISEIRPAILRWGFGLLFLPIAEVLIRLDNCPWIRRSSTLNTFTTGYLVVARKV